MSGRDSRVEFDCPHCGTVFSMEAGDAIYTDNVEDECSEICQSCGKRYQLRCGSVSIEMECTKFSGVKESEP
jgi:uncharacterized Zn-finger protein